MRRRLVLLAAALVLLLTGCITMPTEGPVVPADSDGILEDRPVPYIDPQPPEEGAPPADIVAGFLDAMTATPMQLNDARLFLSQDAVATWAPGRRTVTYATAIQPRGTSEVTVRLVGGRYLDASGAYRGRLAASQSTLTFPMTREDGEWRIADAPDALVVPESWFEGRYTPASLYFFDPSARVLVPEPVFLPEGEQFPTALVRSLLRGPGGAQAGTSRTFLPGGLRIGSVPISEDGVAEIAFDGFTGRLNSSVARLMIAQLAWSLRQDESIRRFRVSFGEEPVSLPGGITEFSVDEGLEFDPTGLQASSAVFALLDGRLVSGVPSELVAVDGPMGGEVLGVRSAAVNLDATTVAGVGVDGDRALVTSVRGPEEPQVEIVSGATDLLRPAWDFADRLWLVDATGSGAQVTYWEQDRLRSLRVPEVTGRRVTRFLVSRDGSRLVSVVRGPRSDRLMISRIRHDSAGQVIGATRARPIRWQGEGRIRIRDVAWYSPTSLAVLHRVASDLYEVRSVPVDGAPVGVDGLLLNTLPTRVLGLVGSPVAAERLYAVTRHSLVDPRGETPSIGLPSGTTSLGYVG